MRRAVFDFDLFDALGIPRQQAVHVGVVQRINEDCFDHLFAQNAKGRRANAAAKHHAVKGAHQRRAGVPPPRMFLLAGNSVDHVGPAFFDGREQFGDLLGRVLEIVVQRNDVPAARALKSAHQRVVLAKIPHQRHGANLLGKITRQPGDLVPRTIGTAVVHQNDFVRQAHAPHDVQQANHQFAGWLPRDTRE